VSRRINFLLLNNEFPDDSKVLSYFKILLRLANRAARKLTVKAPPLP